MVINVPRSAMAGVAWPAIPGGRAATLLAIQFQLEQTQWWPAQELAAWQLRQLALLLKHAAATVPFYRGRLPDVARRVDGELNLDAWREIPILGRDEIQRAGDALHSTHVPREHGELSVINTSGSTGKPIRALRTQLSMLFWEAFTQRDHLWHKRHRQRKLAVIRHAESGRDPYPAGSRASNWGHPRRAAYSTGPCVALNINCTVEQQVEWLQRENPDYLLTFSTNARRLAAHCLERGVAIPNLQQVLAISEVLHPEARELCRQAWNVPVFDTYSARETGYIALQCPQQEHLHVQSEGILAEILDERGRACGPGEIGRVVLTALHNFAMPLLRYEIGDYAEVGEPCACGRGLPVLRRIVGRAQNMLVLANGQRRWTLLSSGEIGELLSIAPIKQYQFVQRTTESIEARLVAERPLSAREEDKVRAWLCKKLDYPFRIDFAYLDEIPLTPSGKFYDFLSEVAS